MDMLLIIFIIILFIFAIVKCNRIKPLLTLLMIITYILATMYNQYIQTDNNAVVIFLLKRNDSVFNMYNVLLFTKILFILIICVINFIIVKIKKTKKKLKTNSFDYLLNLLACLAAFSTKTWLKIVLIILDLILLLFYWNVNFSYSRRK